MKIERKSIEGEGSCNFCQKGAASNHPLYGLIVSYPYTHITEVKTESSGVSVRFCDTCLQELVNYISEEEE